MSKRSVTRKKGPGEVTSKLQQMLQDLRSDSLDDANSELQKDINRIIMELELKHKKSQNDDINKSSLQKEAEQPKELPRREFVLRNSPFTNLWTSPHGRSSFNCFLAFFVLLYLHIAIFYYFNVERFKRDLALFFWAFGQFHIITAIWLALNFSIVFILHPIFQFWATSRACQKNKGLYDLMFGILFILYEAAFFIIPARVIIVYDVPPASSCVILSEQVRLLMKSYAFVRENITRVLKYKLHQDDDEEKSNSRLCPEVGKLIYFLFVPTLVYRDSYPRTSRIRWSFVAGNVSQIFYMILIEYVTFIYFSANTFNKAGIEPIPITDFVGMLAVAIFGNFIASLTSFYSLQSLQIGFAEMLRFGDRKFFDDFWNSTSFAKFYRTWNIIIHDWLYSYIYRDLYAILKSKTAAMVSVFIISAIGHEYIAVVTFKCIFPPIFILFFIVSIIFKSITRRISPSSGNFSLWVTLMLGNGLLLVFYSLEWQTRKNCPSVLDSWLDYVVPRYIQCNVITF